MYADEPALDTRLMRRVGGPLGSNPAGIYEDETGRRFYVKTLETPAHARNEIIAAMLYRLTGAPTLNYRRTLAPEQIATEWVTLDRKHVSRLDEGERLQAQQWFGVHAWTANWDVAGFDGDNLGVINGTVVALDLGGALEFRAQGDPKGKAFGVQVGEFERLRCDSDNPHALRLFGDMDDETLRRAIDVVTGIPDTRIRQVIMEQGGSSALADKMIARKADMASRFAALRHSC
ncbi:hypothetical protein [Methyloterricola oryzae]|uniref:hypothetical protein n=1 Tax=Methyloterricola oryzae TaxID=1495050 RepID=UPI0005EB2350|nr:hypothetical protein [Methyloterricola oryzae]